MSASIGPVPTARRDPASLRILSNNLARRILAQLASTPQCPLDLARSLGVHEQTVYYTIKQLHTAGIIQPIRKEPRGNFTATIYGLVAKTLIVPLVRSTS
ncbi:MAG: winged helix-turn-helix domain-containing protein [Nanoarchaeota archaeon]|nr:winged helix-turn-helix domain-containing protein [Nanoarchaeota archaeon]